MGGHGWTWVGIGHVCVDMGGHGCNLKEECRAPNQSDIGDVSGASRFGAILWDPYNLIHTQKALYSNAKHLFLPSSLAMCHVHIR